MKYISWRKYSEFDSFLKSLTPSDNYSWRDLVKIAEQKYRLKVSKSQIQDHLRRIGVKLGYKKTLSLPVGTIRVLRRGRKDSPRIRKEIKLPDNTWKPYHLYLWEQKYGKLKEGELIVFLDGNPLNCELENLFCITPQEKMMYVGKKYYKYKKMGPEYVKTALMMAKLDVALKNKKE